MSCNLSNETEVTTIKTQLDPSLQLNFYQGIYYYKNYTVLLADDLCQFKNGFCGEYCRMNGNSRECFCAEGWQLDFDEETCVKIDFCADEPCSKSSICMNLPGADFISPGYKCRCDWGWSYDGNECVKVFDFVIKELCLGNNLDCDGQFRLFEGELRFLENGQCLTGNTSTHVNVSKLFYFN